MGNICAVSENDLKSQLLSAVLISLRFDKICQGLSKQEIEEMTPESVASMTSYYNSSNVFSNSDPSQRYLMLDPEYIKNKKMNKLAGDYLRNHILDTEEHVATFLVEVMHKLLTR